MPIIEHDRCIELTDDDDFDEGLLYAVFDEKKIETNCADPYYNYGIPMDEFLKFADRIRERLDAKKMKTLEIDYKTRKQMDFMLVPLENVYGIEIADDDELETEKIHISTTDGITFLNAKKFIVNGKSLDEIIREQERG